MGFVSALMSTLGTSPHQIRWFSTVSSISRAAKTVKNSPAFGVSSPHLLKEIKARASHAQPSAPTTIELYAQVTVEVAHLLVLTS